MCCIRRIILRLREPQTVPTFQMAVNKVVGLIYWNFLRGREGIQVKLTARFWLTNRAFCKTSTRVYTSLAISGHDPPLDVTVFRDIPKNPGPTSPQDLNFSAICNNGPGSNLHIGSEGRAPL